MATTPTNLQPKKTYRVFGSYTQRGYQDVEASTAHEAKTRARLNAGDWISVDDARNSAWDVDDEILDLHADRFVDAC